MTPKRLQECLTTIRWSPVTLAAELQVEAGIIQGWMAGTKPIPISVASWLEALCFTHEASSRMRPQLDGGDQPFDRRAPARQEYVPVYSYNLLRALEHGPVVLKSLFGTDDEGAVFFLVSRGLAEREGEHLIITAVGRQVGKLAG